VMELPFLAPADTAKRAKIDRLVFDHPLIVEEMAKRWNIKVFASLPLPPYEFMGSKRIASVDDMKGVKMRISGLNAKALQNFGAVPTMVTAPEAYTAIERGTIDSIGFPYSYTFGAYRIYEVAKYVTEGMAMSGFMCFMGVSLDTWNKLPKDLQGKLEEVRDVSDKALLEAYTTADKKWIPIFKEKLEVVRFPADERKKIASGANAIWEAWVKEQESNGRPGRKMLDFVKAEVAKLD
jgi:TRAP-type C4-dicarboxylate transport system substrate-binding protein